MNGTIGFLTDGNKITIIRYIRRITNGFLEMKYIGITEEHPIEQENRLITALLDNGLDLIHLRKPKYSGEKTEQLLLSIPPRYYDRIVLHDHFELAEKYRLAGVHLNGRNPHYRPLSNDYIPTLSRSCHSIEELTDGQQYDYLFLSPIFDSISKKGYRSAFSSEQLTKAGKEGVINERVIALGGITPEKKTAIKDWNFGGIAVLGFLWQEPTIAGVIRQLTRLRND